MRQIFKVEVQGDSILKGTQVDPASGRYCTKNDIDTELLSSAYALEIRNDSRFGCTVEKGAKLLERRLELGLSCDAVVMDFGGNDCDMKWAEIAADPEGDHRPALELPVFVEKYRALVRSLKARGIIPVLTTLPPLEPERFFAWWCRDLNKENVLRWLGGSVCNIYAHQETYSRAVEALAREERVPLVDLRGAFLRHGHLDQLICADGTHPNSAGQQVITAAFAAFSAQWRSEADRALA